MHVSANFDSGNIEVVSATNPEDVQLRIRKDVGDEHMQWFHFRLHGVFDTQVKIRLINASKASYPLAWNGYQAVASVDRQSWFRVPTRYEDGELVITHTCAHDALYFAYFAPYSYERHLDLVGSAANHSGVRHHILGQTVDGRDLDMLEIGGGEISVWVIARQHPGETMAEWWMEGFIHRLLDSDDALARSLLGKVRFYVVPSMNPDGGSRGHLRCNAMGANLNREWLSPTASRSPEVLRVRDAMDRSGVDLCLDVHGDEELPYVFIAGAEGIPDWTERLERLTNSFVTAWEQTNPDVQQVHGYPKDEPGKADMSMCTTQVAQRFDCLAMTLEMPFKDNANAQNLLEGWSPARSARLGASVFEPIAHVLREGLR